MKQLLILCLFSCCTVIVSCKKDQPKETAREVLKRQFKGKYKILNATSDQAVDLNFDGAASQQLLTEVPNLQNSFLELRFIDDKNPYDGRDATDLFVFFWQEQDLNYEYDKNKPSVMYLNQSYPFTFSINSSHTEITTQPIPAMSPEEQERHVVPETLQVVENGRLRTSFTKKVYTGTGFKQITVQLLYERWTSET